MDIWTGPKCMEHGDVRSVPVDERAFRAEALKRKKVDLGRSMRQNNLRPLPALATQNSNCSFSGIAPHRSKKGRGQRSKPKPIERAFEVNENRSSASPETARSFPVIHGEKLGSDVRKTQPNDSDCKKTPSKQRKHGSKKWYEKENISNVSNNAKEKKLVAPVKKNKTKKVQADSIPTPTRLELHGVDMVDEEASCKSESNYHAEILVTPQNKQKLTVEEGLDVTPEALERNPDEDVASEEPDVWAEQGYNDDPNYNSDHASAQVAAAESVTYEGKNQEEEEVDVWAEQGYNDDPNYEGKFEEVPTEDVWKEQGYENYGHGDEGYDYGVHGYDQHGHEDVGEEPAADGWYDDVQYDEGQKYAETEATDAYEAMESYPEEQKHEDCAEPPTQYSQWDNSAGPAVSSQRSTPYKQQVRTPAISPIKSPPAEEGDTARRIRTQFQSDRSPAATLKGYNKGRKFRPKTPGKESEKENGEISPSYQAKNGGVGGFRRGSRFVKRGKKGGVRQSVTVDESASFDSSYAIVFSRARHGRIDEVQEALTNGMPVDARDPHGNTLLLIGCQNGQKKIVKLCLRLNANINAKNRSGNTALHFCFMYAYYNLGDYLISKGADDTLLNSDHQTCYDAGTTGPAGL